MTISIAESGSPEWARCLAPHARVRIDNEWRGGRADLLIAFHARRSAASIAAFAVRHPDRPLNQRADKDPLTALRALLRLPTGLPVRLFHIGAALDAGLAAAVATLGARDQRYPCSPRHMNALPFAVFLNG